MDGNIISIDLAKQKGIIISGSKDYIYDKCKGCLHSYFSVALGLNPKYGWFVQCCSVSRCKPYYKSFQLNLFDYA